jgi:hypothetical protein
VAWEIPLPLLEHGRGDEKKGKGGHLKDWRTPISWALGMTLVFEIWSQFKGESVWWGRGCLPLYQPVILYMAYTGNGAGDSSPYYCTAGHRKLLYPPYSWNHSNDTIHQTPSEIQPILSHYLILPDIIEGHTSSSAPCSHGRTLQRWYMIVACRQCTHSLLFHTRMSGMKAYGVRNSASRILNTHLGGGSMCHNPENHTVKPKSFKTIT